ncbi:type II toxin-antitoxin system VapC family toxin [Pseudorhodoferax sp.]|uniref:type II toxin-antitoxin system VapC family toxin n=1 Tax=Pseudorhodoferax sp. TaxID=1993553 RepID=UPI001B61843F|nr:type II toxin-antitoxin system VapC family toxin [Pseudorhodoferax sp.]MBP8144590.1 type II toxin-antitoxin system VapC family toxin [Inhella sp.]
MIAIDTSVLVDYIGGSGAAAESAEAALRDALSAGPVVACEVVLSEVVAGLGHSDIVIETLEAVGVSFLPMELRAAVRAGEMQRRYKDRLRSGKEPAQVRRTIPDFLIGAHALLQCQGLITRDAGFYRDYFKGLKVIVPTA